MKAFCFRVILVSGICLRAFCAEITPLYKLPPAEQAEHLAGDARMLQTHRQGLRDVIAFMDSRPDIFPSEPPRQSRLLRREEKEAAWQAWQRFLDYQLALESLEQYCAPFNRLKGPVREDAFLIGYGAMAARYRAALEFIHRANNSPELDKVLNDPVPELGLPGGTFASLKFKNLNAAIATQFAAREVLIKTFPSERLPSVRRDLREDASYLWKAGQGGGELLTAKNALKVIQNGAQTAWLPVQTGVSEWMGHTKLYRSDQVLITPAQIHELQPRLQPGDVLLERREWYLSNIGLPGFWSHAALYIGTPVERRTFFDDAETRAWVRQQGESSGELEALLDTRSRAPLESGSATVPTEKPWLREQEQRHPVRIIEAIGEGVSFKSLEHSAACDSLVVLRPRLPRREKALALLRAFHYAGRPYDFDFDFSTDAKLVCTELVYKSYEPSTGFTGLQFPLVEMLGRKVTPANELARQFDEQFGTPAQQFDMVCFLDGLENERRAVESSAESFRKSWRRPKWHVFEKSSSN